MYMRTQRALAVGVSVDVITAMETEIDEFESTVDGRLTLSNATTFIELDF